MRRIYILSGSLRVEINGAAKIEIKEGIYEHG
jgi:hypothetical protein